MSSSQSQTRRNVAAQIALRRMRPTTARGPRFGVVGSILFHGLILAALLFTFQRNFKAPEESHVVPVDLVTIADQTNVAAQAPTPPEPQKMDTPPPALEPPPEPQMQAVEPAPEPPIPKFDVEKEKPKPVEKPVEPKPTKKQQAFDFDAAINKLTAPDKPVKSAKVAPRIIQGIGAGSLMTADLADALRGQIYKCWSPPTGAPNAQDLIVDYDLALNPDGTVGRLQMTPGTAATAAGNSYTRAAAEAASRAIYQCQPYRLPADRYDLWRQINPLRFDPRLMMGQ
jgi:type IV secretory pathway VirB10-like protein